MSNRRPRFRISLPKQIRTPQLLGWLIVFQLITLLLLLFAWPSPVTLSFVTPFDEVDYWPPLIKAFEAQHPGIRIELLDDPEFTYTTDDVEAIYTADLQQESPQYDLVYMDIIWVPWFANKGWLQDLSEVISEAELADFLPSEVDAGRYQNGLYRIPFRSDVGVLFYNKRLLKTGGYQLPADLPKTLTELKTIAEDLQNQKIAPWGYLWQGRQYEGLIANFVEVLKSYDGYWIDLNKNNDDPSKVGLDQEAAIKAADFLRNMITRGESTADGTQAENMPLAISPSNTLYASEPESIAEFIVGETAFLRGWSYFWNRVHQTESPLKSNFEIVPPSSYEVWGCRGGWGFGVAKNAKHPKQAWQAIQYFTSAAAQRQFVLDAGYLPSREALFKDAEILKQYPHFSQLRQTLEHNSIFRPQFPAYDQASQYLQQHLWEVLAGQKTPEDAMKQAAAETRQLLRSL